MAVLVGGCANPGRLQDLRDCGRLSVGVGVGLSADVKVGDLCHPSLGLLALTHRVGHESRRISGYWTEIEQAFPAMMISNMVIGNRPFGMSYVRGRPPSFEDGSGFSPEMVGFWLPFLPRRPCEGEEWPSSLHSWTDLEASVTALVVSARVGVNPLEILDFALGFLGLDIAGDDPEGSTLPDDGSKGSLEPHGTVE